MLYRPLIILFVAAGMVSTWRVGHADEALKLTQAQAQSRLQQLRSDIDTLKKTLEKTRTTLSGEQRALKSADLEIQLNALELRKLDARQNEHQEELSALNIERQDYLDSLDKRRDVLAAQILTAYRLGRESRLKLVLNQDSPALLSRTLAYYDYFSRSQAAQINDLKEVLQTLDRMQDNINKKLTAIHAVQSEQRSVLDDMTQQRNERQAIIENLAGRIQSGEEQLEELQRNRKDLETLLEKLSDALSDIPPDLGRRLAPQDLKGKMTMPVKGRVRHAFGQPRTAGMRWQGWLIAADNGTEVNAIAYGRVAFSDWLRGYGLLMIIDHGDGFMSLYGNNESLLHEVGDWVESGTAISTVGANPFTGSGLYFEIRKNSKAMDPAVWLKR